MKLSDYPWYRGLNDPKVKKVVKLDDNKTVEYRALGIDRYHWAFCRDGEVIRWLDHGTLEWDMAERLPYKSPQSKEVDTSSILPFI